MIDIIIIGLVAAGVVFAVLHIRKKRKSGDSCCGCPYSSGCSGSCSTKKKSK